MDFFGSLLLILYTPIMLGNNHLLWEDDTFIVCTPFNPHIPYSEGPILVIQPKKTIVNSWQDPTLTGKAFELSAKVAKIMENLKVAPWFNLQANGNWGLIEGSTPFFHIYVYGRNKTERWAMPIVLPEAPGAYKNETMPENGRTLLINAFKELVQQGSNTSR